MKKVSEVFPKPVHAPARHALARTPHARPPKPNLAGDQGGAIAVMLALMLAALLGMLGLAMDLGKAWNLETELQHAADACALAGATQLDGSDGARARAIDACVTQLAAPLVENTQRFASDGLGNEVKFDTNTNIDTNDGKSLNTDIKFYVSLPISAAVEATTDAEANYIEANVAPRRVDFAFAAVIGAVTSANPRARALAGWTSFFCDSPPMFMCNPAEPVSGNKNAPFYIDSSCSPVGIGGDTSCVGRTLAMKTHAGGGNQQLGPGDWGYLSLEVFDPATGTSKTVTGTKELGEALASVVYDNVCVGNQLTTKPGNMTSLDRMINTRFDLYFKDSEMLDQNRQPARQALKGLVPNPGKNVPADGCSFNPATMADTGGHWWRPQDEYSVNAITGLPELVPDGLPDSYLGPGRHQKVDVLDNASGPPLVGPGDAISDPHPLNEGSNALPLLGLVNPPIRTMAFPNDHCSYPAAAVDPSVSATVEKGIEGCMPSEGGLHMGSGQWDAQTYLDVYHPDLLVSQLECPADFADPNTLCADLPNVPGGTPDGKLSRWELYKWEAKSFGAMPTTDYPNMPQKGKPRCYKGGEPALEVMGESYDLPEIPASPSTPDRRIIVMAVVNCVGWEVKGKSTMERAPGDSHIAVFLTEPMGLTEKDSLNGEIVDPRSLGIGEIDVKPLVVRERVLLIE